MAAKILLVEDDKSLLEIYSVRLQAEGYQIVAASDGEQALAVAIKERPSLIITDVMMPKITGFDMLDILRSTTETKDIKVIMMTALSSDDQRARGERMGADRYLVKSQVGIEDVVRTVHEVLGDSGAAATPAAPISASVAATTPAPAAPAANTSATPMSVPPAAPVTTDPQNPLATSATPIPVNDVPQTAPLATAQPAAVAPSASQPTTTTPIPVPLQASTVPAAPSTKQRIIQPLTPTEDKVNINELLDKELAKEAGLDMLARPEVASTDQEKAMVQDQISATEQAPAPPAAPIVNPNPAPPPAPTVRPASPNIPPRNTPLQAPPRIPTI